MFYRIALVDDPTRGYYGGPRGYGDEKSVAYNNHVNLRSRGNYPQPTADFQDDLYNMSYSEKEGLYFGCTRIEQFEDFWFSFSEESLTWLGKADFALYVYDIEPEFSDYAQAVARILDFEPVEVILLGR